jgi:hypothetical protein
MRYNPSTDNARYTIDEIAEQCRNAVLKASQKSTDLYAEVCKFYSMKDYGSLIK